MQVVRARGFSAEVLARRLARQPDVEYAVPDGLRQARALPNDSLFADQWYLQDAQPAAIRASAAWDLATGANNVVTAVLDTGILASHPDLAGRLLPGYDFISDAALAGDGNGRDADPPILAISSATPTSATRPAGSLPGSEPGAAEQLLARNPGGRGARRSEQQLARHRRHDLARRTAAAAGARQVRRLRLRHHRRDALGSRPCGARHPDQCQPGAGHQPQPGGSGSCSAAYRDTIAELASHGVLVVAAAEQRDRPRGDAGNCAGVLTVAGLRHLGTKVGYSSLGAEVAIAAPAGQLRRRHAACQFPIVTLSNSGTTNPAANTYTDGYDYNVGTSFSAPLAAGTAALMLSLNPALTPAKIIARMQSGARPRGRRRAAHLPDNVLGRAVQLHHRHLRRRHAGRALGAARSPCAGGADRGTRCAHDRHDPPRWQQRRDRRAGDRGLAVDAAFLARGREPRQHHQPNHHLAGSPMPAATCCASSPPTTSAPATAPKSPCR